MRGGGWDGVDEEDGQGWGGMERDKGMRGRMKEKRVKHTARSLKLKTMTRFLRTMRRALSSIASMRVLLRSLLSMDCSLNLIFNNAWCSLRMGSWSGVCTSSHCMRRLVGVLTIHDVDE